MRIRTGTTVRGGRGLVVAMPALAAYALIRNRVDALTSEGLLVAEDIIKPFKPAAKKAPPPPPPPPGGRGRVAMPHPGQ